ncbi:hypothetical protein [Streptomyces hebeiensis]|uniref:hypothetical protein n=1 Tax=Streptomyces hebeiensis TaxID=229486 RepID=UPI003CD097E2
MGRRRGRSGFRGCPLVPVLLVVVEFECVGVAQRAQALARGGGGEAVAAQDVLGTAANLRALMRRETGITPSEYRRRFGPEAH